MSLPELDNLVRIGQLKAEPRNAQEVTRSMTSIARHAVTPRGQRP
jgi:hypothetical protein